MICPSTKYVGPITLIAYTNVNYLMNYIVCMIMSNESWNILQANQVYMSYP